MNSEKVKEIKKGLECCKQNEIEDTCKYCRDCPASDWDYEKECKIDLFQKTITQINELESENERLNKALVDNLEAYKDGFSEGADLKTKAENKLKSENHQLKDRIAELESENERLKTQLEQANAGIVNCSGCRLVEINAVREFAEKLKSEMLDREYNGIHYKWGTFSGNDIDELLKEYDK